MVERDFYSRKPHEVARSLLGARLIHRRRQETLEGYIVETEAYGDENDSASHARFGKTPRTGAMFGPPGHAYVYLIYGIHSMLNIVTGKKGSAGAVLVRAVVDIPTGILYDGPGRVCAHFRITREQNNADLTTAESLGIEPGISPEDGSIVRAKRVGIKYACKDDREALLRYRLHERVIKAMSKGD